MRTILFVNLDASGETLEYFVAISTWMHLVKHLSTLLLSLWFCNLWPALMHSFQSKVNCSRLKHKSKKWTKELLGHYEKGTGYGTDIVHWSFLWHKQTIQNSFCTINIKRDRTSNYRSLLALVLLCIIYENKKIQKAQASYQPEKAVKMAFV